MTSRTYSFLTRRCCLIAALLLARAAVAQDSSGTASPAAQREAKSENSASPAPSAPAAVPAAQGISYSGGLLSIHVQDVTLTDVLSKVAALTGVTIDIPPGSSDERMPVVELGPGSARKVLATLLDDSAYDYLIQGADNEPQGIRHVLLMQRERKGGGASGVVMAASQLSRSPYAGQAAARNEAPQAETAANLPNAQPTVAEAAQPEPPPPAQPDLSALAPQSQQDQPGPTRPNSLSPPAALNSQSINQQLQQMYQQRLQMVQQGRLAGAPASPVNSSLK